MNSKKLNKDIIGLKFGKLIVLDFVGSKERSSKYHRLLRAYNCQCDCGNSCQKFGVDLRSGRVTSCGCWRKEVLLKIHTGKVSPQRNTAGAALRTAKDIWKNTYSDGISFDDFLTLSQLNCHYCNASPSNKCNKINPKTCSKDWYDQGWWQYSGLDRIDSAKNHALDNVVPACWRCNKAKGAMSIAEFMSWVSQIYHYNKLST